MVAPPSSEEDLFPSAVARWPCHTTQASPEGGSRWVPSLPPGVGRREAWGREPFCRPAVGSRSARSASPHRRLPPSAASSSPQSPPGPQNLPFSWSSNLQLDLSQMPQSTKASLAITGMAGHAAAHRQQG
eukprot:14493468-Alexandrium_andersonii.AAC.1